VKSTAAKRMCTPKGVLLSLSGVLELILSQSHICKNKSG